MRLSPFIELTGEEKRALLTIARLSIEHGLLEQKPLPVAIATQPTALCEPRGVFVTLLHGVSLRGCIGSMEPDQAMAPAIADSAYGAAFQDPRFRAVSASELDTVRIEISILSHMIELHPADRADLLNSLQPGTDGLLISDGRHRATFLPSVWEQLPEPSQFLEHLLTKAGLAHDYWSDGLRLQRYTTLTFGE
jgi:AmmeMemoRadiSam system protein A